MLHQLKKSSFVQCSHSLLHKILEMTKLQINRSSIQNTVQCKITFASLQILHFHVS